MANASEDAPPSAETLVSTAASSVAGHATAHPAHRLLHLAPAATVLAAAAVETAALAAVPAATPFGAALVAQGGSLAVTLGSLALLSTHKEALPWWAWALAGTLSTNYAVRLGVLAATRGDAAANQSEIVSRWDATATAVSYFASTAAAYGASRLRWAAPPSKKNAPNRAARLADAGFHWGAWLAVSLLAYPAYGLLPLLRGVPPPEWDKAFALYLTSNCQAISGYPQRSGSDGIVQVIPNPSMGSLTAYADAGGARGPVAFEQNPTGARGMTFVTRDGKDVVVSFAGTATAQQAQADVDFLEATWHVTPSLTVTMHAGFLGQYQAIAEAMWTDVAAKLAAVGPTARVICLGHSLGGACANIAALDCVVKRAATLPPFASVLAFTVAAPQSGDANFAAAFNAHVPASIRVANPLDIVPHLLDGQLVHVKGYMPVASKLTSNALAAHLLPIYTDAITHWNLGDVVTTTFGPLGVTVAVLVLVVMFVAAAGALLHRPRAAAVPAASVAATGSANAAGLKEAMRAAAAARSRPPSKLHGSLR